MPIKIDANRCLQDHKCPTVMICSSRALSQEGYRAPSIDIAKCTKCMECTFFCPNGVFTSEESYREQNDHH